MIVVNIITSNEHYDNILRQIPKSGYEGFCFKLNSSEECDLLVVFEYAKQSIQVKCSPKNTWLWNMEPPDEEWEWLRKGYKYYSKVVTVDEKLKHSKIIHHPLAIPWQVERSYDFLKASDVFSFKEKQLSFITSNYEARKGHRQRLNFLRQIQGKLEFDLWGRGFKNMHDKAEGLLPYKYTLVVENSSYRNYWSEKLADAYLCGCLPIYYGCSNVSEYFPETALIKVDIHQPKKAIKIIQEAIRDNEWEKRKQTIEIARQKVLDEYQFFPTFLKLLSRYGIADEPKEDIFIPQLTHHPSVINPFSISRNYYLIKKTLFKRRYLDIESPFFGFTTYK